MKKLVVKYALVAGCYFSSMTFVSSVRASDAENHNLSQMSSMQKELVKKNTKIESLERKLEDVESRLARALKENEDLNTDLNVEQMALDAIKEYARTLEDRCLTAEQRAKEASSECEIAKMSTEPYLEMEIADYKRRALRDAEFIATQAKEIKRLKTKLALKRL